MTSGGSGLSSEFSPSRPGSFSSGSKRSIQSHQRPDRPVASLTSMNSSVARVIAIAFAAGAAVHATAFALMWLGIELYGPDDGLQQRLPKPRAREHPAGIAHSAAAGAGAILALTSQSRASTLLASALI